MYNKYINMNMNKTSIISIDTLKIFMQGALGAMTFGAYHQYTTNKIMEINNENLKMQQQYNIDKQEQQQKYYIDKQEQQHKSDLNNLKLEHQYNMEKQERQYKIEMDELRNELRNQNDKINKLLEENKKSKWW